MSHTNVPLISGSAEDSFTDLIPKDWDLAEKAMYSKQLIVKYQREPAYELEHPAISHHALLVTLEAGASRQVTRIANCEFEGRCHRGDIWLKPSDASAFWSWNGTDESLVFFIAPTLLHQIALRSDCLKPHQVELKPIAISHDSDLVNLSLAFIREIQTGGLGGQLYSECLANQFAIHLLRHYAVFEPKFREYKEGLSRPELIQAVDYIQAHLHEKLTLEAIAAHLNLSVYYFCTLFTKAMGISPYQYVLQQRIERVKSFLKTTRLALSDIALRCGFNDQSQMGKHFRKATGVTPTVYRKTTQT